MKKLFFFFACLTCHAFDGITLSQSDRTNGLPPVDTGSRVIFRPENYLGTPESKITQAGEDASAVGGAVVLDRVYELTGEIRLFDNVLYTGGGVRRASTVRAITTSPVIPSDRCICVDSVDGIQLGKAMVNTNPSFSGTIGVFTITEIIPEESKICASNAISLTIPTGANVFNVFTLMSAGDTDADYKDGIVIENMLFDGNISGNPWTHHWRYNNSLIARGRNVIKNCYFFDTPSENIVFCGGKIIGNVAFNLAGSFVHKGCLEGLDDEVTANYVERSNLKMNAVMDHAEALVTLSRNSIGLNLSGNIFRHGMEAVIGEFGGDDLPAFSGWNYFSYFPRFASFKVDGNPPLLYSTNDLLDNVTIHPPTMIVNPFSTSVGRTKANVKIGTASDVETRPQTISVEVQNAPQGISISNISVDWRGVVMGEVCVDCSALTGANSVILNVKDSTGESIVSEFVMTVSPNTPPQIGSYANSTVVKGLGLVVTPNIPPRDNGKVSELIVNPPSGFTGTAFIDAETGILSILNAGPAGDHRIEVKATDNCGVSVSKFLNLTVLD